MSKYKKLLNNTLYFFVGNMGSKLLIFFLVPYYTYVLSTAEYGTADLITTTASLIIPVVTLSITEAVFRFSMDEKADYKALFSNGLLIVSGPPALNPTTGVPQHRLSAVTMLKVSLMLVSRHTSEIE